MQEEKFQSAGTRWPERIYSKMARQDSFFTQNKNVLFRPLKQGVENKSHVQETVIKTSFKRPVNELLHKCN